MRSRYREVERTEEKPPGHPDPGSAHRGRGLRTGAEREGGARHRSRTDHDTPAPAARQHAPDEATIPERDAVRYPFPETRGDGCGEPSRHLRRRRTGAIRHMRRGIGPGQRYPRAPSTRPARKGNSFLIVRCSHRGWQPDYLPPRSLCRLPEPDSRSRPPTGPSRRAGWEGAPCAERLTLRARLLILSTFRPVRL